MYPRNVIKMKEELETVSYTHLDVYKRQQGKQPDKPKQTGEVNFQEILMATLAQLGQKMDDIINENKRWKEELKNDRKPRTKEIPNDKKTEQVALLSETEPNRNKENLKHKEMKSKKMTQVRPKKLIKKQMCIRDRECNIQEKSGGGRAGNRYGG